MASDLGGEEAAAAELGTVRAGWDMETRCLQQWAGELSGRRRDGVPSFFGALGKSDTG